ncbi:hypothetical protein CALVIDRAFT_284229 [Calocera viscosa TUFC12733]|uniref:Uncharacterized protein n=1 Tax=Calocera viscosa (strain TUFC12733) TaxID=1330018 RepID=A0A167ITS1_CALVF|nr:hypothetical protein CALVIDRAFT_284229 [Calocera viscosa TUFC12733]
MGLLVYHLQGFWIPLDHLREWWEQQDEMIYAWDNRNTGTISLGLIDRLKTKYGLTMMDRMVTGKHTVDYCDLWVYKRPSKKAVYGYRGLLHLALAPWSHEGSQNLARLRQEVCLRAASGWRHEEDICDDRVFVSWAAQDCKGPGGLGIGRMAGRPRDIEDERQP